MTEITLANSYLEIDTFIGINTPDTNELRMRSQSLIAAQRLEDAFEAATLAVPGLKPLTATKAMQSISESTCFGLDLEREKGGSFLSSQRHADLRKGFFNSLDLELRLAIIERKFSALGLSDAVDYKFDEVVNVTDIGGERAVYKVDLNSVSGDRSVVIKREIGDKQGWYAKFTDELGLPTYESKHIVLLSGEYEITEWLPGKTLSKFLLDLYLLKDLDRVQHLDLLLPKLAQLAALNDIIGLGDHHHDNKIIGEDGEIRQIDISRWVFDKTNDAWTTKYIKGGWYEPSIILYYPAEEQNSATDRFFRFYNEAVQAFSRNYEVFARETDTDFVDRALLDPDGFSKKMKALYLEAMPEMHRRNVLKKTLAEVARTPQGQAALQSSEYDELRMYSLADSGRPSAFYLIEDRDPNLIMHQLHKLMSETSTASSLSTAI